MSPGYLRKKDVRRVELPVKEGCGRLGKVFERELKSYGDDFIIGSTGLSSEVACSI